MNKLKRDIRQIVFSCLIIFITGFTELAVGQVPAFPGAEGYGKFVTGGRGGEVIYVSNLNDEGPGSFRAAIEKENPRIIVFSVSGNIKLKSPIEIKSGDLTIAGQTAPGDGITIRDYPVDIETNNVIVRYIRFRLGGKAEYQDDAFNGNEIQDVIVDHCSMSWSIDEAASFYRNQNFTLQWSIVSESLNKSYHEKGHHGYGGIWGGQKVTFHHNLIAHHTSRNPRFADSDYNNRPTNRNTDFYNNVIYNWGYNSIYGGEKGEHNIVNNYFKPGPATSEDVKDRIVNPSKPYGKFYVAGNVVEGFPSITKDNWDGGVQCDNPDEVHAADPFNFNPNNIQNARKAYEAVLANAGASYARDAVDERVVNEVRTGTATYSGAKSKLPGIIDSQEDVGGWPELKSTQAPRDSDQDGMPDDWEQQHELNPNNADDAKEFTLTENYTNVEVYLNSLAEN